MPLRGHGPPGGIGPLYWDYATAPTGRAALASPQIPAKEAYVSLWLIILIIVIVVLLLGGFGYSRR